MIPIRSALLRCLPIFCCGLLALPAQAIVTCAKSDGVAAAASPAVGDAAQLARRLAGMATEADPQLATHAVVVNGAWQAYAQTFAQPLRAWSGRELRPDPAWTTALYPFSGPDLPSVLAIYPAATRIVMISDQYAGGAFDPFALKEAERARVVAGLEESWARFGRLGFFLTSELNKGGGKKNHVGPTMIMMAFAARLGYEVRAVRPTCLDAADLSIRPASGASARWGSVRLELRKDGRDLVIDYVQQDLSNRGLAKHPETRALIESLAKYPVLFKAASHLPQYPGFKTLRNAVMARAPLVVQDETGLEYDDMAKAFEVKLYGEYFGPHRHFKEATNASLVAAYRERAKEVRPLDFKLGYEKEAGSAIQVGMRK